MSSIANASIAVAQAKASECRECAALLVRQLAEHGSDATDERLVPVLEQVVSDPARGFVLYARENGKMIGVAYLAIILSAEHCGKVGWLEELYVVPEYRSRGIG